MNVSMTTFKMSFYPLYLKSYEKFTFSMSAILDCKVRPSWANSRIGPDCFEISIQKLSFKPMACLCH